MTIRAYTRCDRVVLKLNGRQVDSRHIATGSITAVFTLPYTPGTLTAVAYRGTRIVAEETLAGSLEDGSTASMSETTWERLRGMLTRFMKNLDDRERQIVRARYALGQYRTVQTFQSIADKLGVSKERVRQLEQRAVGKLQKMAEENAPEAVA